MMFNSTFYVMKTGDDYSVSKLAAKGWHQDDLDESWVRSTCPLLPNGQLVRLFAGDLYRIKESIWIQGEMVLYIVVPYKDKEPYQLPLKQAEMSIAADHDHEALISQIREMAADSWAEARNVYLRSLFQMAKLVRDTQVVPFCEDRGWLLKVFVSHWWSLRPPGESREAESLRVNSWESKSFLAADDETLQRVISFLTIEVPGFDPVKQDTLGMFMTPYPDEGA